ncbi:hypothetical protein VF21_03022 [Pseudogymnoascus sp. 05NY08]|nr:hypothetical protein VF21_03022 [Pseudogymnoascus sp. 05NY08]
MPHMRPRWELFHDESALETIVTAAGSLYARYDSQVQAIRSWDTFDWHEGVEITSMEENFLVIIDSMCNMDLLFYSAAHSGNKALADAAVNHSRTLLKSHLRVETATRRGYAGCLYSSAHLVNFAPTTGSIKEVRTAQGYSKNSTWSRGQAWAILGYAQTYHWTGHAEFLDAACGLADSGGRRVGRYVPLWDFDAPIQDSQNPLWDTSAGVIAANGMLVLSNVLAGRGEHELSSRYLDLSLRIVQDVLDFALAKEKAHLVVSEHEVLEHAVLSHQRDGGSSSPRFAAASATHEPVITNTDVGGFGTANLSALAMQIENLTSSISFLSQSIVPGSGSPPLQLDASSNNDKHRCKRQRAGSEETQLPRRKTLPSEAAEELELSLHFLTGTHLEDLLDAYFVNIHPWIPMIHMTTFRRKIQRLDEAADPPPILHAMLAAALRPMNAASEDHISAGRIEREVERSRNKVIYKGNQQSYSRGPPSLDYCCVHAHREWRAAESMAYSRITHQNGRISQPSVEEGDADVPEAFLRPKPLPPPSDWMEQEERRRVFWNIFTLDRHVYPYTNMDIC